VTADPYWRALCAHIGQFVVPNIAFGHRGSPLGATDTPFGATDTPFGATDTPFGEGECPFVSLYGHSYASNRVVTWPNGQWQLPENRAD